MNVVLTIAGSDSCGGAGVQQDLKVFQAVGVHGASVITALTAQNTTGVQRVLQVPPRFVASQIDSVVRDLPVAAVKTGMLSRAAIVEVVAERVRRRSLPNLVVDPVILAKDGTPLLSSRGLTLLRERLLPQSVVVTPNVPEAEALSGISITGPTQVADAARMIAGFGVRAVVIKGGHLNGAPTDTLYWDGQIIEFPGERLGGDPVHGTGCLFSAALTAYLAAGRTIPEACGDAKEFTAKAIRQAVTLGKGSRLAVLIP
jgi:hydroxymethylpyrimidine kinase/phosphomethylpyrimidine kinase